MKHPKFGYEMKTYWDTWEGSYQMGAQKHRLYLLDLLKKKEVTSLLDVGCGTGPILELIQKGNYPFAYKGTDYSLAMVKVSKENFPNGNFEVEDARHLTEADNSWDCVLLMHCLDHLDDYQSAIKEAARVAKKYVCIVLWRPFIAEGTNLNSINTMHKEQGEAPWEDTHLQEYSQQVLKEEFAKNNLIVEQIVCGQEINSDDSHYNWLCLLRKKELG